MEFHNILRRFIAACPFVTTNAFLGDSVAADLSFVEDGLSAAGDPFPGSVGFRNFSIRVAYTVLDESVSMQAVKSFMHISSLFLNWPGLPTSLSTLSSAIPLSVCRAEATASLEVTWNSICEPALVQVNLAVSNQVGTVMLDSRVVILSFRTPTMCLCH